MDKLLRTEVVQCQAVANWVFSEQMQKDFTRLVCPAVAPATGKQLPVSVGHAASVGSFKVFLKTALFSKTFSSVPLPRDVYTCVCVCA